jgi:hypothetical protein
VDDSALNKVQGVDDSALNKQDLIALGLALILVLGLLSENDLLMETEEDDSIALSLTQGFSKIDSSALVVQVERSAALVVQVERSPALVQAGALVQGLSSKNLMVVLNQGRQEHQILMRTCALTNPIFQALTWMIVRHRIWRLMKMLACTKERRIISKISQERHGTRIGRSKQNWKGKENMPGSSESWKPNREGRGKALRRAVSRRRAERKWERGQGKK